MILNIAKLNKELTSIKLEKQELATNMATVTEENKTFKTSVATLEAKVKELETKLQTAKVEEAAVVVAVSESVNKKVIQSLATVGVPEGTVKEEVVAEPSNPDELYKKYDTLVGKDKINFFQKNEKAILKGMRSFHYRPVDVSRSNIKTM